MVGGCGRTDSAVQVCQTCSKELDRLSVGFKDTKGMEAKYLDYSSLNNVFSFRKV